MKRNPVYYAEFTEAEKMYTYMVYNKAGLLQQPLIFRVKFLKFDTDTFIRAVFF